VTAATVLQLATPAGTARAHVAPGTGPRAALVLGHGAGGSVSAPDLGAVARAATGEDLLVVLVEQPYRVAGRRSPPAAARLDAAWLAVLEQLRAGPLAGLRLVCGGRSSGARVACRTAEAAGAIGVLCLAFPLIPPRGAASRAPELDAVRVPVLVVQGERDAFGMPAPGPERRVVTVAGDHRLRGDLGAIAAAAGAWLRELVG
jgi:predicted alpha/beta-hydrolase family hydrolase